MAAVVYVFGLVRGNANRGIHEGVQVDEGHGGLAGGEIALDGDEGFDDAFAIINETHHSKLRTIAELKTF